MSQQNLIRSAVARLLEDSKANQSHRRNPNLRSGDDERGRNEVPYDLHLPAQFPDLFRQNPPNRADHLGRRLRRWSYYASLAIGSMQSGHSSAVITRWEVDGPAECEQLTGTNGDRYWQAFLATLPPGLAEAVSALEDSVRY